MDVEAVSARLTAFVQMSELTSGWRAGPFNQLDPYIEPRAGHDATRAAAQVVEQLLDAVLPAWRSLEKPDPDGTWQQHRRAAQRAIAHLATREEVAQLLGDTSPTLSASGLHRWVWTGAKSLWSSGHYAEAVGAAARQVNAETQTKVGRRDVSEATLFQQCFSDDAPATGKPRLRLAGDHGGRSASSLRRGARSYAEGCYAALRNPAAHDITTEISEHEALEQLAAFSILARWVDAATLVTAS